MHEDVQRNYRATNPDWNKRIDSNNTTIWGMSLRNKNKNIKKTSFSKSYGKVDICDSSEWMVGKEQKVNQLLTKGKTKYHEREEMWSTMSNIFLVIILEVNIDLTKNWYNQLERWKKKHFKFPCSIAGNQRTLHKTQPWKMKVFRKRGKSKKKYLENIKVVA